MTTKKAKRSIPGPKVLLMGDSGTGKTYSLRTLLDSDLEVFAIFTEPGMEVISDTDPNQFHWKYIPPTVSDWASLTKMATNINKFSYEQITKAADSNRGKYTQFLEVLETCNDFVCERTGESFGDISKFGTNRVVVIDSLTGLAQMVTNLTVGGKPVKGMQEWQIIQNTLKSFLDTLTTQLHCGLVVTGHLSREKDEITGGQHITVAAPGKALTPNIPLYFSDVIQTLRNGDNFVWSTAETSVVTKARNVKISGKLQPSFQQIYENWIKQGGFFETLTGDK